MKTKILYRGKSVKSGKWVYGYFVEHDGRSFIIKPDEITWLSDIHGEMECYITEVYCKTVGRLLKHADYDSYYENNEIFQGDIIDVYRRRMDIEDTEPDAVAVVMDEHSISENGMGRWFPQDTTRIKVIGNIYDNPELLDVSDIISITSRFGECPEDYIVQHNELIEEYGMRGVHACCYLCNFESEYVCHVFNGGCPRLDECRRIKEACGEKEN